MPMHLIPSFNNKSRPSYDLSERFNDFYGVSDVSSHCCYHLRDQNMILESNIRSSSDINYITLHATGRDCTESWRSVMTLVIRSLTMPDTCPRGNLVEPACHGIQMIPGVFLH